MDGMRHGTPPGGMEAIDAHRRGVRRGWILVCSLAVLFLAYGLFMFFMVGDKGPPGWDFGTLPDTPGESIYSTYPGAAGKVPPPEGQHVSGRPPLTLPAPKKEAP